MEQIGEDLKVPVAEVESLKPFSNLVRSMLDDSNSTMTTVTLPRIDIATFQKIKTFCAYRSLHPLDEPIPELAPIQYKVLPEPQPVPEIISNNNNNTTAADSTAQKKISKKHKNEDEVAKPQEPPKSKPLTFSKWEDEFCGTDVIKMLDLMNAANHLEIPLLLHTIRKALAVMVRGKTPEQIRQLVGMDRDLTKEEKQELVVKYPWLNT